MITVASENSYDPVMLNGVLQRNELQLCVVINKITEAIGPSLYQKQTLLFGLSFKEGTERCSSFVFDKAVQGATRSG